MSNNSEGQRSLEWAQVDVFAERAYEGNMLAIFPDATGLTDAHMQALARETNLSETTFILPRNPKIEAVEGVRVRIFTTEEELPFAGHPTLGTASWLRLHRPELAEAEHVVLDLNVGKVEVVFPTTDAGAGYTLAEMVQPNPQFLGAIDPAAVASTLGVTAQEMHPSLLPEVVTTGLPFLIAPVASVGFLNRVCPNIAAIQKLLAPTPAKFLYCIAAENERTWHARMPFNGSEDPATGSAAGCAISYLVARGAVPSETRVTIRQGQHVRRPSHILVKARLTGHTVSDVRVRGCTIPVAQGRFLRP